MINVSLTDIDFNSSNITFVDGLTLETVKMKYHWLLNASVQDAIIGEDQNGIVWYFGDWLCGEWYDGTWFSGTWHDGVWKNGRFYAYKMDKFQVLSNEANMLERDDSLSVFINGVWENGYFYSGNFGVDLGTSWGGYERYDDGSYINGDYPVFRKLTGSSGGNVEYDVLSLPTWEGGTFISGYMTDCVWVDGVVRYCEAKNIQWLNGSWFNGVFNGHTWWTGSWFNGDFINGEWLDGTFTRLEQTLDSRFGNTLLSGSTICHWHAGTFKNGEFFSGYITNSGGTVLPSINHNISVWENGTWENGTWWGGHFKNGVFKQGRWKNGVFGNVSVTDWVKPKYVFQVNDNTQQWYSGTHQVYTQSDNYTTNGDIQVSQKDVSVTYDLYDTYSSAKWTSPNYNFYFGFSFINEGKLSSYNTGGTVYVPGQEVYISCDIFTGYTTVTSFYRDASIKYVSVSATELSTVTFHSGNGVMYDRTAYDNYSGQIISNTLGFREFDFGVSRSATIKGYQVMLDRYETYSGSKTGVFKDDYTWFNVGVIRKTDNKNLNILGYNPSFFDVTDDTRTIGDDVVPIPDVLEGYKNKTKVDKSQRTVIYGGFSDTWTTGNLPMYSGKTEVESITDTTIKNDVKNLLNVNVNQPTFSNTSHLIDNVDEVTNLYMRYSSTFSNGKVINITNVKMRLFFEDISGVWENGTWENGTWINGQFLGGKFLGGLWLNGQMNGQLGGLEN